MIWPEEEDYKIKEDSDNRKAGTELQSELNQIEENEIKEREQEGEKIFNGVTIREINNNDNLFYENEDDHGLSYENELPNFLEGRVWLDEDYIIRFDADPTQ